LHAGLDMLYRLHCGFGFYGSFAGSILASHTDVHHLQSTLNDKGKSISTEINLKERQDIMVPGCHLTAGLSWDACCGKCMSFKVKLGYEFNNWFDVPQLRRYHFNNEGISNSATSSDVGVHGATLYADFTY
nr:hypothetical protein [Chlamydiota bacterium]